MANSKAIHNSEMVLMANYYFVEVEDCRHGARRRDVYSIYDSHFSFWHELEERTLSLEEGGKP